jgi:hypothetical protein
MFVIDHCLSVAIHPGHAIAAHAAPPLLCPSLRSNQSELWRP